MSPTHPLFVFPVAIAGALTAWLVIWKRGIVPVYRFFNRMYRMSERVIEEFTPNGGGTMRTAIDAKADKADVERVEAGVLEAIRIARSNHDEMVQTSAIVHEHLEHVAWHNERADVLARLRLVEAKQESFRRGIIEALRPIEDAPGAFGSIVRDITSALGLETDDRKD